MTDTILVPVSAGELIDKITILNIKQAQIADDAKLANIRYELAELEKVRARLIDSVGDAYAQIPALEQELTDVNLKLWNAEDAIRDLERDGNFGSAFVDVARSIYRLNDGRASAKRKINLALGSSIVEEKGYAQY
ncbi:DUF6165 family protein [Sphingomonas pituitosa]|uniref:DUF6165 family protein n=1 Tax=Sphingomonas pituitosa TaxID=99597 RepID=UPI00082FEFB7|nr:DUF6165 family protein [Sphingomonas pituitosa]